MRLYISNSCHFVFTKVLIFLLIIGNPHVGVAIGVALALIFIACSIIGAVFFFRKNKVLGIKLSSGVSFDNPTTIFRRNNPPVNDTLQIITNESNIETNDCDAQCELPKPENLNAVSAVELNPTLYEELRLGTEGAGFKRLK